MPFLIGTDEAGYGPNLGPLTMTGTLWKTEQPESDLYQILDSVVSNHGTKARAGKKLFVADSKKVYSGSIHNLESAVLAMLFAITDEVPTTWRQLAKLLCPSHSLSKLPDQVWLAGQKLSLPLKVDTQDIRDRGTNFRSACKKANVELLKIECVPVFPPQFNSQVDHLGNKATLLSTETLKIVKRLMDVTDDDIEIGCDKHGGRSKYAGLVQSILTNEMVMVGKESLDVSDYTFRENDRDVFIRFQAKGESFLPTALASMVAKYVREIFMMLWNQFWQLKIPDLKPTKGYPVDAKRFKSEIATAQLELGIEDHVIWRKR